MIIALILSIALNLILLISSQDCNNCALLHIIKEKDKKIEMLEDYIIKENFEVLDETTQCN